MMRTGNKITLVKIKFTMKACKNLSQKEIVNLSETARDFSHFVQSYGDFLKIKDYLDIWMVEDPIQMTETVTCGLFQLCFYKNLFNPDQNSKIQNNKWLTKKKTTETLLNELFSLNKEGNE